MSALGQYDIPEYRRQLREACGSWDYYQTLAQSDPSYQDTADYYGQLCQDRQAALTRAIQAIAQQETPMALEGRYPLVRGLGTRALR